MNIYIGLFKNKHMADHGSNTSTTHEPALETGFSRIAWWTWDPETLAFHHVSPVLDEPDLEGRQSHVPAQDPEGIPAVRVPLFVRTPNGPRKDFLWKRSELLHRGRRCASYV